MHLGTLARVSRGRRRDAGEGDQPVPRVGAPEPGQALRGSGDLDAWGDGSAYRLRRDGEPTLVVEHRGHRSPAPLAVRLDGGPPRLMVDRVATIPTIDRIVVALADRPLTPTALRERVGVRNQTLGVAFDRLVTAGHVVRNEDGLAVPVPAPSWALTRTRGAGANRPPSAQAPHAVDRRTVAGVRGSVAAAPHRLIARSNSEMSCEEPMESGVRYAPIPVSPCCA